MKITELLATVCILIAGVCLALVSIRKVFKGDLPLFGLDFLKAAVKIELDTIDKRLLILSAISFILSIIFIVIHFG
jgi:hypothetical protein